MTRAWLLLGIAFASCATMPVGEARRPGEALRRSGGSVRYAEYAGTEHNAWDQAYGDTEMWRWLFMQRH